MRRMLSRAAALAGLTFGSIALAQQPAPSLPQPRITTAIPAGAQAGSTVELTVTGTDVDDATGLRFSHPGIQAQVIVPPEPPDPKKVAPKDKAKKKKATSITTAKFKVTVPANVPVGQYDVRIVNEWGVSNPRVFVVGDRPEVDELEPNDDALPADPTAALVGSPGTVPPKNTPRAQRVPLGTTVNGTISSPTDVDYVVFAGSAGQRVLISCLTASIDSRARPLVEVFAADGRKLAQNRNYADADALADITLPAAGDYFIRVSEFAYQRGGPDSFYRLTVGTGPWIDAVFPPAVTAGTPAQVTVYGRNLPGGKPIPGMLADGRPLEAITATVTPPGTTTGIAFRGRVSPTIGLQDGFEYRVTGPGGASNPFPIFLTPVKVVSEQEKGNDLAEIAEPLPVPCEVAGRIDRKHDRDFYSFAAKKGDTLYVTLLGEQTGGMGDLFLRVRDAKGRELAGELDDDPDPLHPSGFYTRCGDPPAYKFTAPADDKYFILVGGLDAGVVYGPRAVYRLRVAPPRPDFRAVVMAESRGMPEAMLVRPGGEVAYDVFVDRVDGFADPVTVTAEGLPSGVTAKPAVIGSRMKWGALVLSAAAGAAEFTGPVTVKCTATINGQPVTRPARPASLTWGNPQPQNNNMQPLVSRLDQELVLAVRPDSKAYFRLATDLASAKVKTKKDGKDVEDKVTSPLFLKPGDKLTLPVKVAWQDKEARANPVAVTAIPTQQNVQTAPLNANNNQPVSIPKDKAEGSLTIDVRSNAAPGTYGLVLRGETQVSYLRDPEQKDKKTNANVTAFADPIEVTVLPSKLANVKVSGPPNNQIKLGTAGDLTVVVERQFDFEGAFQVTVTLPKDTKGVTAKAANIPAGTNEVKVPLSVAADAKTGSLQNITVEVTATVHGKFPIAADAKLNLNIVK